MKLLPFLLIAVLFARPTVAASEKVRVSTFSTILTEIAQRVGGDRVDVTGHVKPGVDPHEFSPKPADLSIVSRAHLVLLSAKHMESYVGKLKESTGAQGTLVEVGNGFSSLKPQGGGHAHGKGDDHDHDHHHHHADEDPHWWHSIGHMQKATRIVRDALIKTSAEDTALFKANAAKYEDELEKLSKWSRAEMAKLPRNQRKLVTSHDAFQYLAKEHGFKVHPIEGLSSADQPSSKKVGEIIETIKAEGVKAIFAEDFNNPKVLQEITRETGAKMGGKLYADGLGAGAAGTYDGMYRHNITTIVNGLR